MSARSDAGRPFFSRFVNSVERAAGYVGDYVRGESGARPPKKAPAAGREGRRDGLRREIDEIEEELARLHARITSGSLGEGAESPDAWILRARELREKLHERRLELIRMDRRIERERRLRPSERDVAHSLDEVGSPEDDGSGARRQVAAVLRRHPPARDVDRQILNRAAEALFDPDAETRRRAVTRLADLELAAREPLLRVATEDSSDRVRLSALHGLLAMKRGGAPILCIQLVNDPAPLVRAAALSGLARSRPRAATPLAMKALEDRDPEVRRSAVVVLGLGAADEVIAPLGFALGDSDESVRLAAVNALGGLVDERAAYSLIHMLDDPFERVRAAAARSLKATVGDSVEAAAAAMEPEGVVMGLSHWWLGARIELGVTRSLASAGVALDESLLAELLRSRQIVRRPVALAGLETRAADTERAAEERQARAKERAGQEEADAERAARDRAAEDRAAEEQAAEARAVEERAAEERAAEERAAEERAAEERAAEERAAEERAAEERAAEERAAEERAAEERAAEEESVADEEENVSIFEEDDGDSETESVSMPAEEQAPEEGADDGEGFESAFGGDDEDEEFESLGFGGDDDDDEGFESLMGDSDDADDGEEYESIGGELSVDPDERT